MKQKTIYLLIGPKGSGKSYIGRLIDRHFQIKFLPVEEWAMTVKKDREVHDQSYIKEVFKVIENGIRAHLTNNENVVFESTGLSDNFDKMLDNLRKDFIVRTIRIIAQGDLCLKRVKNRDQSIHVNVSDDQVLTINYQVEKKSFNADFAITNNDKPDWELIEELKKIII